MPRDGGEIGPAAKPGRRSGAIPAAKPRPPTPRSANIGPAATPARRGRASSPANPKALSPSLANTRSGSDAGERRGQERVETQVRGAPSLNQSGGNVGDAEGQASFGSQRESAPASEPPAAKRARGMAKCPADPKVHPPSLATSSEIGSGDASGIGGHRLSETQSAAAPDPNLIVAQLKELQRLRVYAIKQQSRIDRSFESLIAGTLGFHNGLSEDDRKALFGRARKIREAAELIGAALDPKKAKKIAAAQALLDEELTARPSLRFIVEAAPANALARSSYDAGRDRVEAEMRKLARQLPVWEWAKPIKGFGELALAIICGEAGIPIGDYRTVSGLWKRLGLAVINGKRQQKVSGDAALEHGYNPSRRAQVWAMCSDSMFRHQVAGAKDEDGEDPSKSGKPVVVPAHPTGPYGEVYYRRRAHTASRIAATADLAPKDPAKWTAGRCHNDARRVMTKALIRDLYAAWRREDGQTA